MGQNAIQIPSFWKRKKFLWIENDKQDEWQDCRKSSSTPPGWWKSWGPHKGDIWTKPWKRSRVWRTMKKGATRRGTGSGESETSRVSTSPLMCVWTSSYFREDKQPRKGFKQLSDQSRIYFRNIPLAKWWRETEGAARVKFGSLERRQSYQVKGKRRWRWEWQGEEGRDWEIF